MIEVIESLAVLLEFAIGTECGQKQHNGRKLWGGGCTGKEVARAELDRCQFVMH